MRRLATSDELEIYNRLRGKIARYARRNLERTQYVDAEKLLDHYGMVLPDGKTVEQTPMFWPQKAVEVFGSRLRPAPMTVSDAEAQDGLDEAWAAGQDFIERLAISSALVHGPSFIFTTGGDVGAGEPRLVSSVSSALTATAEMSRSGVVTAALELAEGGDVLYLPGRILEVYRASNRLVVEETPAGQRVPCAVYVHDAQVGKPFGRSRVSRPIMRLADAGVRTFMRSEVSADWYSYPRERVLGVGPDAFEGDGWWQAAGSMQGIPDIHPDDDPNVPDALRRAAFFTAPQMSMQPFSDQMRLIGAQFSGASSIPPSYLGIVADSNPTSAEAIWAQEVDLVRSVEDQQPSFNRGRRMLAANILTALHPDMSPEVLASLVSHWQDAKTRSPQTQGEFVARQVDVGNFQAGTRETLDLLPIPPDVAKQHADANRKAAGGSVLDRVLSGGPVETPGSAPTEDAQVLKAKFEALGLAVRAGVDPADAATRVGLAGIKLTGAVPVSLRLPESDAGGLEEK